MYQSKLLRRLACSTMVLSMALMTPAVVEASGAKARSSVDRRLRPGQGYFQSSVQTRSVPRTYSRASSNGVIRRYFAPSRRAPARTARRAPAARSSSPAVRRYVVPQETVSQPVDRQPVRRARPRIQVDQ